MIEVKHFIADGVNFDDVKVGEYIDMEGGCFLRRNVVSWTQIDGGYGLEVNESDVKEWLKERK